MLDSQVLIWLLNIFFSTSEMDRDLEEKMRSFIFFSFLTASAQILLVFSFSPNTHSWGKGEKKTGFPLTSAHNSGHVCTKLRLAPDYTRILSSTTHELKFFLTIQITYSRGTVPHNSFIIVYSFGNVDAILLQRKTNLFCFLF